MSENLFCLGKQVWIAEARIRFGKLTLAPVRCYIQHNAFLRPQRLSWLTPCFSGSGVASSSSPWLLASLEVPKPLWALTVLRMLQKFID